MQFGVREVGNLVILHFILPLKFLFSAPSHIHHSHLTPQVHNRRREEGVFCTSDSGSHPSDFVPSSSCALSASTETWQLGISCCQRTTW